MPCRDFFLKIGVFFLGFGDFGRGNEENLSLFLPKFVFLLIR